jgi:hypothetical protein
MRNFWFTHGSVRTAWLRLCAYSACARGGGVTCGYVRGGAPWSALLLLMAFPQISLVLLK